MTIASSGVADARSNELYFRLRRGLDLPIAGAPTVEPRLDEAPAGPQVGSVAILGRDAAGARLEPHVEPGARVRLGQTLAVDRRRAEIRFTAPGAGVVRSVERGPRRRVEAIVIDLEGDEAEPFERVAATRVLELGRHEVASVMLASGLWTALRTRPFSRIPDPGAIPHAIFVTAMESAPLAPPAESIIGASAEDFSLGVAALTRLTDGTVYVCTSPEARACAPAHARVRVARFAGPHPAGLPGTHIHAIDPVGPDRMAWHLPYPEVIALGRLLVTGELPTERIVALAGPSVVRPRLVRTRLGASTDDLVRGELGHASCRVLSGSVLEGQRALGWGAYLGRLHTQVCALPEPGEAGEWGERSWLGRVLGPLRGTHGRSGFTTARGGSPSAFFPLERLERAVPLDLPVVPLLRALVTGDAEAAAELGCLELDPEDLALVSFLCPAKLEYGHLLRSVLNDLEPRSP